MSPRPRFVSYVLPAVLYSIIIYLLSSLQAPPTPTFGLSWGDKVTHAGAFGLMMLFVARAMVWFAPGKGLIARLCVALAWCSLYGASDEIHQYFVPGRECDIFDWAADTTGALIAFGGILLLLRWPVGRMLYGVPAGERSVPSGN